jgi:diaminohydroxyphosphoribosylaminopyrimidine deaminase/5-amino-6-(5-phosphoribosylamino)uracil reductase
VIDPRLEIPLSAKLVTTATIAPTTIFCSEHALNERTAHAASLREAGVEVIGLPTEDGSLPLGRAMKDLVKRHDVSNVMVEAGAGLMSRLFQLNLVNEAWMFIAPMLLGDAQAPSAIAGWITNKLMDAARFKLIGIHRRKDDIFARYRATPPGNVAG